MVRRYSSQGHDNPHLPKNLVDGHPIDSAVPADPTAVRVERRKREWTVQMVENSARSRGVGAEDQLLGVFDVLDDVLNRGDREARLFVDILNDISCGNRLNINALEISTDLSALFLTLASEAQLRTIDVFVLSWQILVTGTIRAAVSGDLNAAIRGKEMATELVRRHSMSSLTAHPVAQKPGDDDWFDTDQFFDMGYPDL